MSIIITCCICSTCETYKRWCKTASCICMIGEEMWVGDILGGHYHIGDTEDMQGNKTNKEKPIQSEKRKVN